MDAILSSLLGITRPNDFFDNSDWNNYKKIGDKLNWKVEKFDINKYEPYIDGIITTEKLWRGRLRFLNCQIRKWKKLKGGLKDGKDSQG